MRMNQILKKRNLERYINILQDSPIPSKNSNISNIPTLVNKSIPKQTNMIQTVLDSYTGELETSKVSSKDTTAEREVKKVVKKPSGHTTLYQKKTIPLFEDGDQEMESKHVKALNQIIKWFNKRIVEEGYHKRISGLYLWSRDYSLGKTLLCTILSKIRMSHWHCFTDKGWQQNFPKGSSKKMKLYILNGVNTEDQARQLIDKIEFAGDRQDIVVPRRNQHSPEYIAAETPYIINSNKPVEELLSDHDFNATMIKQRLLIVCCDECPLFPLIDRIADIYNIKLPEEIDIDEFEDCFEC